MALLTPWFWTPSFHSCETINYCCFKPPCFWYFVTKAQENNTQLHSYLICFLSLTDQNLAQPSKYLKKNVLYVFSSFLLFSWRRLIWYYYSIMAGSQSLAKPILILKWMCTPSQQYIRNIFSHFNPYCVSSSFFITNSVYEKCNLIVLFGSLSIINEIKHWYA